MKVQLRNDKSESVRYEYWTCHALAPGSVPGDTKAPRSTEIVAPIEKYSVGYGTDGIDRAVDGGKEYKNLAFFRNWKSEGIAYAEPAVTRKWWGVLNHDNEEGLFRIVDDPGQTPGLKFWTWGYRDSYPLAARERQFIELWAGAGHQFFSPVRIAGNTVRTWTETYIPTVGLKAVSQADEKAVVSKAASRLSAAFPLDRIGPGKQILGLKLCTGQGIVFFETGAPITVSNVVLATRPRASAGERGFAVHAIPGGGWICPMTDPGRWGSTIWEPGSCSKPASPDPKPTGSPLPPAAACGAHGSWTQAEPSGSPCALPPHAEPTARQRRTGPRYRPPYRSASS